jgi:hypothetical protein
MRPLQQGAAVVAVQKDRAVGYLGGAQVSDQDARVGLEGRGASLATPN